MIGAGARGPAGAVVPGAGTTWADAGGAAPTLGGIYPVDTAGVAVTLGTSPSVLSRFLRVGSLCMAKMRIRSGTAPASGQGYTTIEGLPVAPHYFGAGNDGGNPIGFGMLFDITNAGRLYPVRAVIDPAYSLTKPIIFVSAAAETVDKAGDQDATVWKPRSFATPLPIMHGGGTSYPTYGTLSPNPFDLAGGFILNVTMFYEAA